MAPARLASSSAPSGTPAASKARSSRTRWTSPGSNRPWSSDASAPAVASWATRARSTPSRRASSVPEMCGRGSSVIASFCRAYDGSMFDLDRFVVAQKTVYDSVVTELRAGHKTGHWMWFIFPQLAGLGRSEISRYYGIVSLREAVAYLAHPVLGPRLRECANLLLTTSGRSATEILGVIDGTKVRSSMTLFYRAEPTQAVFGQVLDRFFDGAVDPLTDELLG